MFFPTIVDLDTTTIHMDTSLVLLRSTFVLSLFNNL
jgi:hypothetical protein